DLEIPASWERRRIVLRLELVNSLADVYVDGRKAGSIRFPGGDLDLTNQCQPDSPHSLHILVFSAPLKTVMLDHEDPAAARRASSVVARRGICGDVWLIAEPREERIDAVRIDTSVSRGELTAAVDLAELNAGPSYRLRARIADGARTIIVN